MLDKIVASEIFVVRRKVERFTGKAAWYYVKVPRKYTKHVKSPGSWGFVPISATLNNTEWKTYLFPFGDKTFFVALKKSVREAEDVSLDDNVVVKFRLRER